MKDKLKKLLEGVLEKDVLTEELMDNIGELFENAVTVKVAKMKKSLQEEVKDDVREELGEFKEKLIETMDKWLNSLADEIIQENRVEIVENMQHEINQKLVEGIVNVFDSHNISLPKSTRNALDEITEEKDSLQERLNETISENLMLKDEVLKNRGLLVFAEETETLTFTQKEKLKTLLEDVDIDDLDEFRRKIKLTKDHFLSEDYSGDVGDVLEESHGVSKKKGISAYL